MRAFGRYVAIPLMKAGDMSMLTERTWSGVPLCAVRYSAKWVMVFGVLAFGDEDHLPFVHIGGDGQIIVAAPAGRLVDGDGGHRRQVGFGQGEIDVARTDRMNAMPRFADQLGDGGKVIC